ncbi:Odorant receptor 009 [Nylanderia fulva]|uniref:Odorant receptor n=1 Tax=Nylanderia fulva TaxID=613905 RepID=A0A6G1LQP6_9HYME|nr:odorant receptor Or1-like [Nylanderia fulva]KAF3054564.1 Odorant receptor 009 [Nylanderia fulva]
MDNTEEKNIEINLLELPFKVLTLVGCWQPKSWTSVYQHIIYQIYSLLIIFLVNSFTLSQLMDIILIADNTDDFCDTFSILIPMVVACFKLFSLLASRKNIIKLIDILNKKPCKPLEPNEIEIYYKFNKGMQINTFHYSAMCFVTITIITITSILTNFGERKLTYRAWIPFEYNSSISTYCSLFIHQLIGLSIGALVNISCDTLICGLMEHICCQFEILTDRLKRMLHSDDLRICVQQHCKIFKLATLINENFRMIITVQFLLSMFIVCFNLYTISLSQLDSRCIRLALFMGCMLTQIFVYCWFGNQVKLKSRQFINNIFEIQWFTLDNNLKKSLIIMMKRSVIPIEITSAYTIPVNLDSFMGILKTSYSVYNLLKQTKD